MNKPSVSVVIPTFNRSSYLKEALESVFAQTYTDYEIIVVDDGSTDNTPEVINSYLGSIRYIRWEKNKGPSAARNYGAKESRGTFIAFLDSDDLWEPQALEKAIPVFESNSEIGLVAFTMRFLNANDSLEAPMQSIDERMPYYLFSTESLLHKDWGKVGMPVIRRECIERVGGFDETLLIGEDIELWLRISLYYKAALLHEPLYVYRMHERKLTGNTLLLRYYTLQTVKKFISSHPAFAKQHSWSVKRALSGRYAHLAKHLLLHPEDIPQSPISLRKAIFSAIRYHPYRLKGYRYAFFAILGSKAYIRWHQLRKTLRRRFISG